MEDGDQNLNLFSMNEEDMNPGEADQRLAVDPWKG